MLLLCCCCAAAVLLLCCYCAATVLLLCCYCAATVLLLCCYCAVAAVPIAAPIAAPIGKGVVPLQDLVMQCDLVPVVEFLSIDDGRGVLASSFRWCPSVVVVNEWYPAVSGPLRPFCVRAPSTRATPAQGKKHRACQRY